jgi:hypothetical protein
MSWAYRSTWQMTTVPLAMIKGGAPGFITDLAKRSRLFDEKAIF